MVKNVYSRIMGIRGAWLIEMGGSWETLNGVSSWGILGRRSSWYSVMIALAHFGQVPSMGIHILAQLLSPSLVYHPFQSWDTPWTSFFFITRTLFHEIRKSSWMTSLHKSPQKHPQAPCQIKSTQAPHYFLKLKNICVQFFFSKIVSNFNFFSRINFIFSSVKLILIFFS